MSFCLSFIYPHISHSCGFQAAPRASSWVYLRKRERKRENTNGQEGRGARKEKDSRVKAAVTFISDFKYLRMRSVGFLRLLTLKLLYLVFI